MMSSVSRLVAYIKITVSPQILIAGTGVTLALFLAGLRILILKVELGTATFVSSVSIVTRGSSQDWALVLFIVLIALTLHWLLRSERGVRWHVVAFMVLCNLMLLLGVSNVLAVHMLGGPLTLAWVKYSDIFNSPNIFDSILYLLNFGWVLAVVAILITFTALSFPTAILLEWWLKSKPRLIPITLPLLFLLITLGLGNSYTQISDGKLSNPAIAFGLSLFSQDRYAPEFALQSEDGATQGEQPIATAVPSVRPTFEPGQIKNVVVFALESTPAKYAQGFGGEYPITPNLLNYSAMGRRFTNAYAHAPASNFFLVSLMAAIVPELSPNSMTTSYPDLKLETIATVLGARGFRTGFFNSSDNRFQDTANYMKAAGVDTVLDHRDWDCQTGTYESEFAENRYLNTSNDRCTIGPMTDWIAQEPQRPFLLIVRTGMTHFPYYPGEESQSYVEDETLNRYLNAVRVGDEAFGLFMDYLVEQDLLESTLVVVLGDHGEAFGEHGTVGHASAIYEENLHVPLVLINPKLFSGGASDVIAGVSDLSPTILDILDIPKPASWQGFSLFEEGRPDSVLFFAPWNGFQIGFRSGTTKFIYNASSEETFLFDLAADPTEQHNLVLANPSAAEKAKNTLGRLVLTQNDLTDRLLKGVDARVATAPGPSQLKIHATGTRFKNAPKARIIVDGVTIGHLEVTSAPVNADASVSDNQIDSATTIFTFLLEEENCSRRVEIYFLNDEWEGEGETGNTDLYVRFVELDNIVYWPEFFELITEGAGKKNGEYFAMWRNGGFAVNLALKPDCITNDLVSR